MTLEHNHSTREQRRDCAGCAHERTIEADGVIELLEDWLRSWLDTNPTDADTLLVLYQLRDLGTAVERSIGRLAMYVMIQRGLEEDDEPEDLHRPTSF